MSEVLGPVGLEIENRLKDSLNPEFLEVIDESELHRGHAGYREGGQSHFKIIISSQLLRAYSRVEQHKKIYAPLDDLMKSQIHALSIEFK